MSRTRLVGTLLLLASGMTRVAGAEDVRDAPPGPAPPPGLAGRAYDLTEAVLRHHPDPPTRQQMVVDGIRRLNLAAGLPAPSGLGRRASTLTTPEQFAALLTESWPSKPKEPRSGQALEEALVEGMLAGVPGGAYRVSAKEQRVQEQLEGNRYVGIHIQLRYEEKEKESVISALIPGGPADRAGARKEDRIEAIDGVDTRNMPLAQVVDRLRGESGTRLVVRVRQPKEKEPRTLTMTRAPLFLPTIAGIQRRSSDEWDYRAGQPEDVGYLRIRDISASTPHELRRHVETLQQQGFRALVIDLRGVSGAAAHPAILLADSLLEQGRIGRIREANGERTYDATAGSLCPGWPLAVLVDEQTTGAAAWVAAALQDNHRAVLVGHPAGNTPPRRERGFVPPDTAGIRSSVPIGEGEPQGYVNLLTGWFERGDGRALAAILTEPAAFEPYGMGLQRRERTAPGALVPDVPVARKSRDREPAQRSGGTFGEAASPVDPWTDPVLQAALKRLAESRHSF